MKKILVTGALGQIGSELVVGLRKAYGNDNVIASSRSKENSSIVESGPFEIVDVTKTQEIADAAEKHKVDSIIHLAAILSAVGERNPLAAWDVNMNGTFNVLEVAREKGCAVFTPSSIAAFGPSSPPDNTPQDTIQRPTTMYGVTKVAGELLCDYYYKRFGVDTRGVRFPGLISYVTPPGGGTTDYAVDIYYEAIKVGKYSCFLNENTSLDMMYMPDALDAIIDLMEADSSKLLHRNAFNVTAMNFTPKEIYAEIKKHIPEFTMDYNVDPIRQSIADSWPNSLDDTEARKQWGWNPKYDLTSMTADMIEKLRIKLK